MDAHSARALLTEVIAERGVHPEFTSGPTRLEGGKSADLFTFRLSAGPHDITGPELVLRIPARRDSLVECVAQASVAELGFATPPALRFGRHADHGTFLVMPRVPGSTLFESAGPWRSLRAVPARLADLLVDLHDLDPEQTRAGLQPESGWQLLDRTLADIEAAAQRSAPLAAVHNWLTARRPDDGPHVVCHGDLHALNVLVHDDETCVLDWELAGLAPPAFDVARTRLLLRAVPMELPRPIRPVIERLGLRIADRFERSYTARRPINPATVRWHETLHATRIIALLGKPSATPMTNAVAEGWRPTVPLLRRIIARSTDLVIGDDD